MAKPIEYVRPWLYPAQESAIFNDARYAIVEASTKAGKTVSCLAWLLEQALNCQRGQHLWWVAPVYPQAAIAYRRMRDGLPRGMCVANATDKTLIFPHGVTVWFKSGEKPDNLYGEDVQAAVVDEASRCREESWHAIRSTLTATRGPVRIIGNVKGRKNWFYHLARRAEAGEPGMHYAKLTAHDAVAGGVLDAEEIDQAKRDLPENIFRELYLAEPDTDEGNPFGISFIRQCIAQLSLRPVVAWGVDLAKSMDYTVIIGLDENGTVAAFSRFQLPWSETFSKIIDTVGCDANICVDSTGVGDPIAESLQRELSGATIEAFKFTRQSKQPLIEGLAVAIQSGALAFPAGHLVKELESYEYEYTRTGVLYTAPPGLHDDCVCALALAYRCLSRITNRKKPRVLFV